jgi:hypothetical protein
VYILLCRWNKIKNESEIKEKNVSKKLRIAEIFRFLMLLARLTYSKPGAGKIFAFSGISRGLGWGEMKRLAPLAD